MDDYCIRVTGDSGIEQVGYNSRWLAITLREMLLTQKPHKSARPTIYGFGLGVCYPVSDRYGTGSG